MPQSTLEKNLRRKIKRHLDAIARVDHDVATAVARVGYPVPRIRPAGFETFLSIIVSQQISTAAAASISRKLKATLRRVTPGALLKCEPADLRAAGLSLRKVEYARGLAQAIQDGGFDVKALEGLDDGAAIQQISSLRGFGRWSAEIYLMFSLQRTNIFPADDLALQVALQKLKGIEDRLSAKQAREIVEPWQPHLSAGSLFLWHFYSAVPLE